MHNIEFTPFSCVCAEAFLPILNKEKVREHLITHPQFDLNAVKEWMQSKECVDAESGCIVRAILVNDLLVGWCGIQQENAEYELAIVLDKSVWGIGQTVFKQLMQWAQDFGHDYVYLHLLSTRPEYRFLRKRAVEVFPNKVLGQDFLTYKLAVCD